MKKLILSVVLLVVGSVTQAEVLFCKFEKLSSKSEMQIILDLNCGEGQKLTLIGTNNSPCRAASNVAQFSEGLRSGDALRFEVELRSSSTIDGASQQNLEVVEAHRAYTGLEMVIPTVIYHGKPRLCSSTHAIIGRQR